MNQRLPRALNTGFAAARGTLLSWTSDDNHYQPNALAELAGVLSERPDVDFVYADYGVIDEDGKTVEHVRAQESLGLLYGHATIPCFLYRRTVYDHLGGYAEDLALAEDYDFWLQVLLSAHRITTLHQLLYEYRRHAASLTDRHHSGTFVAAERALLRHVPAVIAGHPELRGQIYLTLASFASWRGALHRSGWYALQAARYAPVQLASKSLAYAGRRLRRLMLQ
jgi:glycosyltransferase involved in cell wall biosynthesis